MVTNKRVIDLTLDELAEGIFNKLKEKQENEDGLTTDQLAQKLNVCVATIGVYGRAGMYKYPGARIKKNRWDYNKCREFVETVYQNILSTKRKRPMLNTTKKA